MTHPPQMFLRLFPLQLVIQLFHCLKYYYTKDHYFSIKKRLLLLLKSQKIMQNGFCLTFFSLFPLEKRRIKKSFSSPASSWVLFFFLPGPVGLLFLCREPCYFSKAFVYNNPSCGSAHPAHFARVNVKKTKFVKFKCVLWCSPSKSFMNRGFILLLKSGCIGHFGRLFDFGGLGWEKDSLGGFSKCYLWVCCFWQISVIDRRAYSRYNSGETWKYISPEIVSVCKAASCLMSVRSGYVHSSE